MNRRAAGGAGRPGTLLLLLGLLVGSMLTAAAVPAGAAPADTSDTSTSDAASATGPVDITVTGFEPRTVTPESTITISGTLTNASDDTVTDLSVRLQRGNRLADREALAEDVADPAAGDSAQAPFGPVDGVLEPGDDLSFSYTTTAAELALTEDGVYPVLVNVNGTRSGQVERVGELSTHLVVAAPAGSTAAASGRVAVAWWWPLTARPHRDAAGSFVDDDLADEVSADGRLDRALDVLEELGETGLDVPVTLAVDPALVEELTTMAGGYTVDGATGRGATAAADWLTRLQALAAVHPVVALPYGDVDADALSSAGLSAVVTRSLPGTAEGTAAQPADDDGDPLVDPSTTGSAAPEEDGAATGAGARILSDALDVEPRTDIAWPAGGAVRSDTLATLAAGGVDQVLLAPGGYVDAAAAVGANGTPAAARVPVDTPAGQLTTLVADATLTEVLGGADAAPGGARIAEQRYLAELAVLAGQSTPTDPAQTVLVVPPRQVQADASWAVPMMADTATQPWLAAASVAEVAEGPSAGAGQLVEPAAGTALDGAALGTVVDAVDVRDDVAAAVDDPGEALAGYDAAIARAASVAWREDPVGFGTAAADLQQAVADLQGRVTLVAPADGTYRLASNDAPLVLTVRNDLPFPVTVRLDVRTRGGVGFTAEPVAAEQLEPESLTTVTVPTSVRQSGSFTVVASLSTPAGGQLGADVQLRVSSAAYGGLTLAITIGAAGLLGLLFLRRLVLYVLRRRREGRAGAGGTGPADDETPAVDDGAPVAPRPPTRSPV